MPPAKSPYSAVRQPHHHRRSFLKKGVAASVALMLPRTARSENFDRLSGPVQIGLIADLHQDVMHDGARRMSDFVEAMGQAKPNAILQLGDFAYPNAKNKDVISMFNGAHQRTLHVIGNHDTDSGHTQQQCLDVWGMPAPYYVQEIDGVKLIVLDGNDKGSPTHGGGYPSFVGPEQLEWLEDQLKSLEGPMVVASHQPLAGAWAVDNAQQVQAILGEAADKILLAINGHSHIDHLLRIRGVTYLHINSASYQWVGGDYKHQSYDAQVHEEFTSLQYTCPYRDCLYGMMTIDPTTQTITIAGNQTEWVGKSPAQLGCEMHPTLTHGEHIAPRIRDRNIVSARS